MPMRPPAHSQLQRKQRPPMRDHRPSACARGYDRTWQRLRLMHIRAHPLCKLCEAQGLIVQAEDVDHVIPHQGNDGLRLDPSNLQSLCKPCHSRKTATQDGGMGNQKKGAKP